MTNSTEQNLFRDDEKRECCLMASMGCDRQTTCHYLGKSVADLRAAMREDEDFRQQMLRAEAQPEFRHMRNIYQATQDEKQWRASVWWLERRSPERYGKQPSATLTARQLDSFSEALTAAIVAEVTDEAARQRLLARLMSITEQLCRVSSDEVARRSRRAGHPQNSTVKQTSGGNAGDNAADKL